MIAMRPARRGHAQDAVQAGAATLPTRLMRLSATAPQRANFARSTLAPLYGLAGVIHLAKPALFLSVMPAWVLHPEAVITITGVAELAGAIGLFVGRTRRLAGAMLALYAVCVYPANILHAVHDLSTGTGLGMFYHYPRLFAQPFICWWALAAGGLSPFRTSGTARPSEAATDQ